MLPLVALAIFVAWLLYFRQQKESVLPKPVRILLAVTRFLVVVIVGLLIISPWIRTRVTKQNKPYFIVAQDNSVSIPPVGDQTGFIGNRLKLTESVERSLGTGFQIKDLLFGSQVTDGKVCTYTDPLTDPGELFNAIKLFAQTHDLAGVLVSSDGVSTKGVTFSEAARDFPFPVTVIASGDSTRFPDVRIHDVIANEWVRKNSTFPVRVYYSTGDMASGGFKLQISGNKGVIDEKVYPAGTQASPFTEFLIQSPDKGTMQLVAKIIPDQPDKNQDNNSKRFSVKVIEQEGEILCLYESAHPDIDAIVQALRGTNSLNVNVIAASEFVVSDKDYDLIILHGLPSLKHPLEGLLKKSVLNQVPVLFIIGKTTEPAWFNQLNSGMTIDGRRKTEEASQGIPDPAFSLYTLPADFKNHLNSWPPLSLSFENYRLAPGSQILMKQKILNIELSDPLIAFSILSGIKYGFFCGQGIWLWRMHEFLEQKSHEYFDDWLSRTIQYLMVDEKKDRFKVIVPESSFAFAQVRINAHLLNNSLEAVNDPDVLFTVTDSVGQVTEYQMARVNDYYELSINGFAPGLYHYSAVTRLGGESLQRTGSMDMLVRPVEQTEPVADFEALRSMARATNGKFFYTGQEVSLIDYLNTLKPAEIKIREEFKWYDLINLKWLLPFLIFLLALEWFLRRWFGVR